jgi:hypothetical protein
MTKGFRTLAGIPCVGVGDPSRAVRGTREEVRAVRRSGDERADGADRLWRFDYVDDSPRRS